MTTRPGEQFVSIICLSACNVHTNVILSEIDTVVAELHPEIHIDKMEKLINMLLDQCSTWKKEVYPKLNVKDTFIANSLGPKEGPRRLGDHSWDQSAGSLMKSGNFSKTKDRSNSLPIVWVCIGTIDNDEDQQSLPAPVNDANNTYNIKLERGISQKQIKQEPVPKKRKAIKQEPEEQPMSVS